MSEPTRTTITYDPDPHPDLLVVSLPKRVAVDGTTLTLTRGWKSILVDDASGRRLGEVRVTLVGYEAIPTIGRLVRTGSDVHAVRHLIAAADRVDARLAEQRHQLDEHDAAFAALATAGLAVAA